MRIFVSIAIIVAFIVAFMPVRSFAASDNKPVPKIESGLDDLLTGPVETPDSIDESKTKGTPAYPSCTAETSSGVGRAVVKVVGGAWKLLTFWYPED